MEILKVRTGSHGPPIPNPNHAQNKETTPPPIPPPNPMVTYPGVWHPSEWTGQLD